MKLVIDISEDLINNVKRHGLFLNPDDKDELIHAVNRGENLDSILEFIKNEIGCHVVQDDNSGETPGLLRMERSAKNTAFRISQLIIDKHKEESEDEQRISKFTR